MFIFPISTCWAIMFPSKWFDGCSRDAVMKLHCISALSLSGTGLDRPRWMSCHSFLPFVLFCLVSFSWGCLVSWACKGEHVFVCVCACECVLGPFNKVLWNSLQIPRGYHCDSGEDERQGERGGRGGGVERARERERELIIMALQQQSWGDSSQCAHKYVTKWNQNYNCDDGSSLELH